MKINKGSLAALNYKHAAQNVSHHLEPMKPVLLSLKPDVVHLQHLLLF